MALLPQIDYGNPLQDGINLYTAGLKLGDYQREQNALRMIGQILAGGQGGGMSQPQPQGQNALAMSARPSQGAQGMADSITGRIRMSESGGRLDARNPRSSAYGPDQFIASTWLDMLKRNRPDIAAGKSDAELLALRSDDKLSGEMTQAYADQNANALRSAGFEPTPGNLKLSHFAGAGGARAVLGADPNTPVARVLGADAMRANPFLANMTAGQLRQWADKQMAGASTPAQSAPVPQSAGPDYGTAANAAFRSGNVQLGNQLLAMKQAGEDRGLAQSQRKQELALKAQGALANIADTIQTPEQFEMAKSVLAAAGMDVSRYTFDQLPVLRAQAIDAKTRMELQLKQQLADAKTGQAGANSAMPPALQRALATQDAKTSTEYNEASQGGADIQRDLQSLSTSRDQTNFEGSWFDNWLGRTIGRNIGGDGYIIPTSKDVQALDEMNASAGNLTLSSASKLKGVLSDADLALLRSTVPDSDLSDAAAGKVITGMEAGAERAQMRSAMYDAWLETHGSGRGFQEAWSRFSKDNPVFSKDESGELVANAKPKTDWSNYLTKPTRAGGQSPQVQQQSQRPEGMSDAQIIDEARKAVAQGKSKEEIQKRLDAWGIKF